MQCGGVLFLMVMFFDQLPCNQIGGRTWVMLLVSLSRPLDVCCTRACTSSKCRTLVDTGTQHSCSSDDFVIPDQPAVSSCPTYNQFKYGLNFTALEDNFYVKTFADDDAKLAQARLNVRVVRDGVNVFLEHDTCTSIVQALTIFCNRCSSPPLYRILVCVHVLWIIDARVCVLSFT